MVPTHLMWAPVFRVVAVDKAGAILDSLHLAGDSWNAEPARAFLKEIWVSDYPQRAVTLQGSLSEGPSF